MYKTVVIEYSPKADDMALIMEQQNNYIGYNWIVRSYR